MIGITNSFNNKMVQAIFRYSDLALWLDGTDYLDHSPLGCSISVGSQMTISTATLFGHTCSVYNAVSHQVSQGLKTDNTSVNLANFSLSIWWQYAGGSNYDFLCYINQNYPALNKNEFALARAQGAHYLWCQYYGSSGGNANSNIGYVLTYSPPTWYHTVITVSGNTMKGYFNGSLFLTQNTQGMTDTSNFAGLYATPYNSYSALVGSATDFRIYNYLLSDAEIYELFTTGPQQHR